jgi:DNA-binding NarL/FixJ family response regulator
MHWCQIILANEPRLLRSMFRQALGKIPRLEIVGELADLGRLPSIVDQTDVHWVIVSLSSEGSIPHRVASLLTGRPSVGVVGIASDGSLVRIRQVGLPDRTASSWSLDELVAALFQQQSLVAIEGM